MNKTSLYVFFACVAIVALAFVSSASAQPQQRSNEIAQSMADDFITCIQNGVVYAISPDGSKMLVVQCRAKIVDATPERKDRP